MNRKAIKIFTSLLIMFYVFMSVSIVFGHNHNLFKNEPPAVCSSDCNNQSHHHFAKYRNCVACFRTLHNQTTLQYNDFLFIIEPILFLLQTQFYQNYSEVIFFLSHKRAPPVA
jgi:hypothetical protein